ncbi:MAG: PQQ-dependent sugar dehydrogenase, partial [Actinobacteria bacterium]|nr:PQQ-dependent sugar dehydrogenase [Actinomycetota bacterium]
MNRFSLPAAGALVVVSTLVGCGSSQPSGESPAAGASSVATVPDSGLELTVSRDVTTGLQAPWSMALLPGAEQALVSERDSARILLLNLGDGTTELAGEV